MVSQVPAMRQIDKLLELEREMSCFPYFSRKWLATASVR